MPSSRESVEAWIKAQGWYHEQESLDESDQFEVYVPHLVALYEHAQKAALEEAAAVLDEASVDEAITILCIDAMEIDNAEGKRHAGIMGNQLRKLAEGLRARAAEIGAPDAD